MDVMEKLVELVGQVQDCGCDVTDVVEMNYVENITLVDHLIANGVTVQEWISVKDRLPDKDKDVWCYSNKNGGYMFIGYRGYISGDWMDGGSLHIGDVTHWMPLPQPPKGE